ncbi:MAG: biotin/lipoyl-containing protein, partial [Dokdonella sp.]
MANHEVKVPDIGNYTDIPVIEVLVKPGDTVSKDQGLVTLESDKATMEVPSSVAGVVKELKVKLGDGVSEGMVVAIIEEASTATATPDSSTPATPAPAPAKPAAPMPAAVATVAVPSSTATVNGEHARTSGNDAEPDASMSATRTPPVAFDAGSVLPDQVPYASPAIRLLARELGVDLGKVSGSARKGRITREDVQNFVKGALAKPTSAAAQGGGGAGLNLLPWPLIDFAKFGEIELKPRSKIKKISGANLARNWVMIPHVTQFDDADITDLEALRVGLNK